MLRLLSPTICDTRPSKSSTCRFSAFTSVWAGGRPPQSGLAGRLPLAAEAAGCCSPRDRPGRNELNGLPGSLGVRVQHERLGVPRPLTRALPPMVVGELTGRGGFSIADRGAASDGSDGSDGALARIFAGSGGVCAKLGLPAACILQANWPTDTVALAGCTNGDDVGDSVVLDAAEPMEYLREGVLSRRGR